LFWSRLDIELHETALDLLGAEGEFAGEWSDGYLFSLAGPIYGGTDQIQRNTIAERLLGLPRDSAPGKRVTDNVEAR
jgi:alkylation response protein AidB-like acyl-CoA dehydrogenase